MFDIYVDSSKHKPVPPVNVSSVNATEVTEVKEERDEDKEVHLSLSTKELIDAQSNDTFCSTILKLINDKKMSSDKNFIQESALLHKDVREDEKLFHALVVSLLLTNMYCIKHMMH